MKSVAINSYKKCLYCGRRYPSDTKKSSCDCEVKGYLYTVSGYYAPKVRK